MGLTVPSLDTPVTKGTSGVTVLTAADLGYNVLHFKLKLKEAAKHLQELMTEKNRPIYLISKEPTMPMNLDR